MSLPVDLCAAAPSSTDPDYLDSIISLSPTPSSGSYEDLVCSDKDKENISRLITVLGESGYVGLLRHQFELIRLGREITHVHPLRFLGTILSDKALTRHVQAIYENTVKWKIFMYGLYKSLSAQQKYEQVSIYINDFAHEIGIDPDSLQEYVKAQAWEQMVVFLIKQKAGVAR
jgi:hypothetical protein